MLIDLRWVGYPQLWAIIEHEAALQEDVLCPMCGGSRTAREMDGVLYVCAQCDGRGVVPVCRATYSVVGPVSPASVGVPMLDGTPAGEPVYTLQTPQSFIEHVTESRVFSSSDEAHRKAVELSRQAAGSS